MSLRRQLIRLAYENPELRGEILPYVKSAHGAIAFDHPDIMLYYIDPSKNNSKFYEMKIERKSDGAVLHKRWGRLTDSGSSGRIDSKDETYPSVSLAQQAAMAHAKEKLKKGYKLADKREYPIGLGGAGFGWGGQAACNYVPELKTLKERILALSADLESFGKVVSTLEAKKSSLAPSLKQHMQAVQKPVFELRSFLDRQLSTCD